MSRFYSAPARFCMGLPAFEPRHHRADRRAGVGGGLVAAVLALDAGDDAGAVLRGLQDRRLEADLGEQPGDVLGRLVFGHMLAAAGHPTLNRYTGIEHRAFLGNLSLDYRGAVGPVVGVAAAATFLAVALVSIGLTLVVSWRLEGSFVEGLAYDEIAEVTGAGFKCDTRRVDGHSPHEGILEVAHDCGADLIAMGTHGRRGLLRLLAGSVAEVRRRMDVPLVEVMVPQHHPLGEEAEVELQKRLGVDELLGEHERRREERAGQRERPVNREEHVQTAERRRADALDGTDERARRRAVAPPLHPPHVDPLHPDRAGQLVVEGPNGLTRNPMYVGMAGVLVAHAVRRGSWTALLPAALFVGAGNIIFPPIVGLQSGPHVWMAALGFLITAVGLPVIPVRPAFSAVMRFGWYSWKSL